MHRLALVALACCSLAVTLQAQTPPKIAVFVGPQTRGGFVDVDSGVLDSIKDITNELRGIKRLSIVATKSQAQVVLEVLSRGATSTDGGGSAAVPIGTSTFFIPIGTIGIATVLRVGTYEKPLVFQNCGGWRYCARLLAKDVETWIEANAATLSPAAPESAASTVVDEARALSTPEPKEAIEQPRQSTVACSGFAATVAAAPGSTLAAKIRTLHPEAYRSMSDEKLESLFRLAYPCLLK